jgi:C-terminal processing protease CtpA/Prc
MENKHTFIAIAVSAILSSACTAASLKLMLADKNTKANDSIASQITRLESALAAETLARVSLQQEINKMASNSEREFGNRGQNLTLKAEVKPVSAPPQQINQEPQREARRLSREQFRLERLARQQPEYRIEQLVLAGFAQEEAARIVQIEAEASLRQLQSQYNARRERASQSESQTNNVNPIRAELGDLNYQRYLEANGLATSARISSVIGGSPGDNVGLRAGDNILSYAGERVFNLNEINNLTVQGQLGENVLIELERDNELLQLTIPRGPIGISSGGGRFRR